MLCLPAQRRTVLALLGLLALLALSFLAAPAHAAAATSDAESSEGDLFPLEGSIKLPRDGPVPSGAASSLSAARVLLNGGELVALVRADGSWRFPHVAAGRTYTLDVSLPAFDFPTLKVDMSARAGQRGKITALALPGRTRVPLPLVLRPLARAEYFQKREPVNVFAYLKNPMVIMMLITVFMAVVMPRMMSSMNPEELAEMQKMQSSFSLEGIKRNMEKKVTELKDK